MPQKILKEMNCKKTWSTTSLVGCLGLKWRSLPTYIARQFPTRTDELKHTSLLGGSKGCATTSCQDQQATSQTWNLVCTSKVQNRSPQDVFFFQPTQTVRSSWSYYFGYGFLWEEWQPSQCQQKLVPTSPTEEKNASSWHQRSCHSHPGLSPPKGPEMSVACASFVVVGESMLPGTIWWFFPFGGLQAEGSPCCWRHAWKVLGKVCLCW